MLGTGHARDTAPRRPGILIRHWRRWYFSSCAAEYCSVIIMELHLPVRTYQVPIQQRRQVPVHRVCTYQNHTTMNPPYFSWNARRIAPNSAAQGSAVLLRRPFSTYSSARCHAKNQEPSICTYVSTGDLHYETLATQVSGTPEVALGILYHLQAIFSPKGPTEM